MPAAIAIPLIIGAASTGASIYAAKKGADASRRASDVQVQASDKAMEYQQQQQRAAMDYAERMRTMPLQGPPAGGAQSYLSKLMGIPGGSGGNRVPVGVPTGDPYNSYGAPLQGPDPRSPFPPYQSQPPMAVPRGASRGYSGLMGGGGGTVMIQAPNGQTRAVPADQAEHYISMGARRVG